MKRFLALAALVLGLAACQTEPEGLDVIVGGEVDTVVSVSLPEATRAGVDSAVGFDLGTLGEEYKLRYILEIYRVENGITDRSTCQRHIIVDDATNVAFPVRLAPNHKYQFVAWADIVETDADMEKMKADRYYNTASGLDEISIIKDKWVAMDETRDAFTAKTNPNEDLTLNAINLELHRPFAKLRVVATDYEDVVKLGLKPASATVEYSQENHLPLSFDALTGAASNAEAKSHNTISYATPVYDDEDGEFTLFADYFFVPASGTAKFSLNVYADAGLIKANSFNTEIFVEANKLTTIKGDVLTTGGNVSIKIENDLGELETINYADSAETLQELINNAPANEETNITLGGDIDLKDLLNAGILSTRANEPTYGLLIPKGKSVVLDLNGHTISQSKAQTGAYAMIDNKGTLTIEDSSANKSGKIAYGDTGNGGNYVSNTISNSGVLTIKGGTIENNSSATVASNGYPHPIDNSGVLTINDGTFNNANYSSMRIWCTTDDDTIVTINGGTFYGSIDFQTPNASANKGTLTINGGTFNADTYTNCTVRLLGFGADVDEMNGYIKGGVFNGAIALKNWSGSNFNSKVFNITGGTFTVDPSEFVDDDYNVNKENNVYTVSQKPYVIAKIGETEYRSLKKAVNNAVNGDTITFVMDVKQADGVLITDKNLTIDLNGKTFTITDGANTNNRNFKVNGTSVVTIKNGTLVAEGELTSGAYGTVRTEDTAVANLEDLKLYSYRGYGLNVKANTGTTINIKDSEIYARYSGGVEAAGGNIELTNVKIDQKGVYSSAAWCSVAIGVNGGGKVTVNSGDYSASAISTDTNAAQGTWVAYVMSSGGTLDIKGGTFNGVVAETAAAANACGIICADRAAVVNIYGGTFNSNGAILDMRNNIGTQPNPIATLYAGTFSADPRVSGLYSSNLITVAAGSEINEANGIWTVRVAPVAMIGETEYETFEAAVAAAKAGDTVTLLKDVTLTEELQMPADITLNGNGKQINGTIYAGGNLTFAGHTKVTSFSASYYNRVITIGEGACLEVTGSGRVTLGYRNTFNITGSLEDAKTADKANVQPSLIIPGGISITGGSGATMNVTNAYVQIGDTSSKNSVANGTFALNFNNAIAEFTKQFTFAEPTNGNTPTFNLNVENSVLTTGTKLIFAAPKCNTVIDNSNVTMTTYFRNSGELDIKNGSVVTGSTIQFGENGGNDGTTTVNASTFTINASSNGHALDGKGTGKLTLENGAEATVTYYKNMTINVDSTSTFTGTEAK